MSNTYYLFIDRLKGFTILLVVMGHIGLFPMHPSDTSIFQLIYSFHMPLFMFLSGWVISPPMTIVNIKKKIIKYLTPFFFFGTLFSFFMTDSFTIHNFIKSLNFLLGESKNGYWYFLSLAMFYSSLFLFRLNKQNKQWCDIFIASLIYIIFYFGWKRTNIVSCILSLEHAACFYPFYILGVLSRKYKIVESLINQNKIFTLSLFLYIGLIALEPSYLPHYLYTVTSRFLIPLFAIIVFVYIFATRESKDSKVEQQLSFFGKNTLSIYTLHFFILYKIDLEVICPWFDKNNNTFILLLIILFISIIVTYSSIYAGNLIKMSNLVRRWIYNER